MASPPQGWGLRAALAALLLLCASESATAQDAPPASPLTIISRGPEAEIRIRGVSLKSVRSDDAQNEVAFDFNGPVSDEVFSQLQDELPDWIDMAFAGYDNAVIRAKRPVTFMARAETDGFSLRMVPRQEAAASPPPKATGDATAPAAAPPDCGSPRCQPEPFVSHDWHDIASVYARLATERPFDPTIRGAYDSMRDGSASVVVLDADWRHSKTGTLYSADAHASVEMWSGVRLLADAHDVIVNSQGARQPGGVILPYNANDVSGSLGLGFPLLDSGASAEVLYGRSGFGGRIGMSGGGDDWRYGMRAAYHEPYIDISEDFAYRAERDYSALFAAGQILDGLWAAGEIRGSRYGIKGDQDVATTGAFHAGLRYDIEGMPLSLMYDADGEYLIGSHQYAGAPPTPFVPLSLRNREVHSFGGSFSNNWGTDFWFDLYGGYAIDRYANRGPYAGAGLRITLTPGWDIMLNGRYSTVADKEGDAPNKITASLRLIYAWGAGDAPIFNDL